MGFESDLRGIDPGRARDEAAAAMVTCIEHIALKRPVVLVLSDLHWSDDLPLHLVDTLLEPLPGQPFVALAPARRSIDQPWHPTPAGRPNRVVILPTPPPPTR